MVTNPSGINQWAGPRSPYCVNGHLRTAETVGTRKSRNKNGAPFTFYCKTCHSIKSAAIHTRHRHEAIEIYGGKCNCCGESNYKFLQFDHINNDGAQHRRDMGGGGLKIVAWARKNNWPNTIQLLCANCNCARGYYGECPHVQS